MASSISFRCNTVEETQNLGISIGKKLHSGDLVSLRGSLGAGKTIIAKGIALALEIEEAIVSPTFTLIQEYSGTLPLIHMDVYRIDGVEEFDGIGGEELLYQKGVTLIEWSEKIDEILPPHTIYVSIEIGLDQERIITIKGLEV
ncbi:MAG: tRNA (adenosine(37)-N6)-threonylcarbamoyltransferase complex ATPase subunit type 1 TsaE [Spirochaetia bacterium]|nr:tRNA (adenosine(37)-N6)-threonylcarbamoyltransferase complex ATPase subunit type 1 TsaE [Spirochaetia bacterium]